MKEIWKDVIDYEGLYEISNYGKVRNLKTGRTLKEGKRPKGYVAVTLYKGTKGSRKTFLIHRLVISSFYYKSDLQVNHIDCNTNNNRLDNLEYVTNQQNMDHAILNNRFEKSVNSRKRKIMQIDFETLEILKVWDSTSDASRSFNVKIGPYRKVKNEYLSLSAGYLWRFFDKLQDWEDEKTKIIKERNKKENFK